MHDNYEKDLLSYTNIWAAKTKMFEFNSLAWNLSVSIRPEIYLHFSEYVTIVAKCKGNSNLVGWLDPLPLIFDEGNAPNEKIIFDELLSLLGHASRFAIQCCKERKEKSFIFTYLKSATMQFCKLSANRWGLSNQVKGLQNCDQSK